MPQQRRKRCQRRQVGMRHRPPYAPWRKPTGRTSRPESPANGSASEPLRLQRKTTPSGLVDRLVNADPKTKPRMPRVQQFPKLGPVGVLKPCCTTRCVHTRASAISRRTSSWLDCQTQRPVMQRARTLRCAGLRALARCTTRSARSTCMKHGTPSQANRGPKNPGRSKVRRTVSVFAIDTTPTGSICV